MRRGDVVLAPFPFQDRLGEKIQPAVVVQSDVENVRLANTVLAMVTGNLRDTGRPTTLLIDPSKPEGAGCGLLGPSLLKCYNLATMRQGRVLQVIGHLSDVLKQRVNDCLKAALELP
jgi:mRNA interferase MazF